MTVISDQKRKIIEIFDRYDTQNTGYLDREQIWMVMDEIFEDHMIIGYVFCEADVESLLRQTDLYSDGRISIDEFVKLM